MLGEKIAEQRKKLGLSQEELAEELNISRSTLAGYEAENKKPSYKVLGRMAEYFGVTTDYLLELEGEGNTMLGNRITELRKACDMSQKELGEKLGVSASAIGMYEQGRREPSNAMMIAMEKLFGVTVDYLLGVTDTLETGIRNCGNTIKELRTEAGMTQEELGKLLNVQNAAVSKYESGKIPLTGETLLKLSKIFNVSTDYLLGAEERAVMEPEENEPETGTALKFGNRLRELRVSEGITQLQMAVILDTSKSNISKYEAGTVEPGMETINEIARFFEVTTDYLFGMETGGNTMIGGKIADLRKELGLNQEELAERLNVKQPTVANWELDRREPDLETVKKIASLFGVTTDYLLGLAKGGNTMLGKRINELRRASGMTQEEFGKKLGVIKQTVSSWENDLSEPNHAATVTIAKLFGVTTDYLLGAEEGGNTMLGKRINELRKSSGMTQEELGKKLGVVKSTISLWESDSSEPNHAATIALAKLFGVTTDYLLGAEGDAMGTEEKINEIAQRVGRNIRSIREQAGLSQRDFAEGFGVSNGAVGMWETGKRQPDLNMLIQIAHFGGTNLDDLVMKDLTPPVPLYVRNMVYLRKKRGYSQGELATVLGLQGASSIDLVESGKCELPVSKLVHLAEFFGVTMDQITRQDLSQEVSECRQQ